MDQALEHKESDVKYFLLMLWKNRYVFGFCLISGIGGALLYLYTIKKPMYEGSATINTGYITQVNGARTNLVNTQEIVQELEDVFIESPKVAKDRSGGGHLKEVSYTLKNPNLPLIKIVARGEKQEYVQEVFEQVLAHIQAKNTSRVASQMDTYGELATSIDARIADIQQNVLPYLDQRIRGFKDDYTKLRERIDKNPALMDSLVQLQVLIDNAEKTKNELQNTTLIELDKQKAQYVFMLTDGSIKNAEFVARSIAPQPSFGVKVWVVLVLGVFCGAIVGVLIVSLRELVIELRRYKD